MALNRLALSVRMLFALVVAWVVLFAIAGAAFNGTSSADDVVWGIVWVAFLAVIVLLVVRGAVAVVRSRRSKTN